MRKLILSTLSKLKGLPLIKVINSSITREATIEEKLECLFVFNQADKYFGDSRPPEIDGCVYIMSYFQENKIHANIYRKKKKVFYFCKDGSNKLISIKDIGSAVNKEDLYDQINEIGSSYRDEDGEIRLS